MALHILFCLGGVVLLLWGVLVFLGFLLSLYLFGVLVLGFRCGSRLFSFVWLVVFLSTFQSFGSREALLLFSCPV